MSFALDILNGIIGLGRKQFEMLAELPEVELQLASGPGLVWNFEENMTFLMLPEIKLLDILGGI